MYEANYGDDYPLDGPITYFEAYMFVTTDKHMREHRFIDPVTKAIYGNIALVGKDGNDVKASDPSLDTRKSLLTRFNKMVKAQGLGFPDASPLSCVLLDLIDLTKVYDAREYRPLMQQLEDIFVGWCQTNKRVGAIVWHQEQGNRPPHLHMLYERAPRKHNEFQEYLDTIISGN